MPSIRLPHPGVIALGAAVAALGACGGGDAPAGATTAASARAVTTTSVRPAAPARPALCGSLRVRKTGAVSTPDATEVSGLVVSPSRAGVLWAHNDSGDRARLFALRTDGSLLASVDVAGAEAVDWEDLAVGPGGTLLAADIGDNRAARDSVAVYRIPEPPAGASVSAPAARLRLRYPDGAQDAETLLADRRTGELVVVTKRSDGRAHVYAGNTRDAEQTLRRAGSLRLGVGGLATAGDVSADGRTVVVRTYTALFAWTRRPGASLAATLARTPCVGSAPLWQEGQGEAMALSRDGQAFLTIPEGAGATVRRYTTRRQ
jgi:hypothetical protein